MTTDNSPEAQPPNIKCDRVTCELTRSHLVGDIGCSEEWWYEQRQQQAQPQGGEERICEHCNGKIHQDGNRWWHIATGGLGCPPRHEQPSALVLPVRVEGWHKGLYGGGWHIKDATGRIILEVSFDENEELEGRPVDGGNALARQVVAALNAVNPRADLLRATADATGERHHKHCSSWTVTLEGQKKPCDCVCACSHPMGQHIRPGEHYWYEDCAVDGCPCLKFTATTPRANGETTVEMDARIDRAWIAGAKFGWNCSDAGNSARFNDAIRDRLKDNTDCMAQVRAARTEGEGEKS